MSDPEVPESDIEPEWPQDPPKRNTRRNELIAPEVRSIATLNLNLQAAEEGRVFDLLPEGYKFQGDIYPLPQDMGEVARLSALKLKRGVAGKTSQGARAYIKRCRDAYGNYLGKKRSGGSAVGGRKYELIAKAADDAKLEIEKANAEVAAKLSEFRLAAQEATASLTSLYALAKTGLERVLTGYVKDEPVNGEPITAQMAVNAAGKVLQQVAKLGAGLDPEDKEQAEEEVFKEYEATRVRLGRSSGKVAPGSGEEPH